MRFSYKRTLLALGLLVAILPPVGVSTGSASGGAAALAFAPEPAAPGQPLDVRWGFYITYNPNSLVSLQANAKYLNYVSPWYFYVNGAGQVTGADQPQASRIITSAKAKSLPMVKNTAEYNDFTGVLSDTNKQDAIVNSLDSLIAANGYDGITIDFEGLNATDRPLLTAFMGRLYARLHPKQKLVAMAVAAKSKDTATGWSAPYDYPALSEVTDYLLVMAYDYHWSTSDPGPVAPVPDLRGSAAYTATHVPPRKVIWGVGVYGYDWGMDDTGATVGKAEYRSYAEAAAAALTPGSESGYDDTAAAPWVRYTRDAQQREIWYENRRSFEVKLALVRQNGFAGFSLWRLGQEDPGIWDSIAATPKPAACSPIKSFASSGTKTYFPETRHSLGGVFLKYWQEHGGLPVYGYPLTEEFMETSPTNGKRYKVQYFERNRFEYHPENKAPNDVQLGLLGVQTTRGRLFAPEANPATSPDIVYFPQVQHTLAESFLQYWQAHGGLAQFGYPISEPVLERNTTDGKTYLVQYMQRARFERHPEYFGSDAEVLLGLLGLDVVPCK